MGTSTLQFKDICDIPWGIKFTPKELINIKNKLILLNDKKLNIYHYQNYDLLKIVLISINNIKIYEYKNLIIK